MRAVLINPFDKSVSEVEYSGDYKDIYTLIGCDLFTVASDDQIDIWLDDEGLYKPGQAFFWYQGMGQPFAGKGLILCRDNEGESIGTSIDIDEVTNKIRWYTAEELLGLAA